MELGIFMINQLDKRIIIIREESHLHFSDHAILKLSKIFINRGNSLYIIPILMMLETRNKTIMMKIILTLMMRA